MRVHAFLFWKPAAGLARKNELRSFIFDDNFLRECGLPAVGDALVVGTKDER